MALGTAVHESDCKSDKSATVTTDIDNVKKEVQENENNKSTG